MAFSFVDCSANPQTPEQTLLVMAYELGKVIEYHHKSRVYGSSNPYYCDSNQQKEMSDLISMVRMFCEQKGWDFDALKYLGEECYLERMEDIRKHGINTNQISGGK